MTIIGHDPTSPGGGPPQSRSPSKASLMRLAGDVPIAEEISPMERLVRSLPNSFPRESRLEALHESWLKAHELAHEFHIDTDSHPLAHPVPAAWMWRTTIRFLYNTYRDQKRKQAFLDESALESTIPSPVDQLIEDENSTDRARACELLRRILATFAKDDLKVLTLNHEPIESLLDQLDPAIAFPLRFYLIDRAIVKGRYTYSQIGFLLYPNEPDVAPAALGQRARNQHVDGMTKLKKRVSDAAVAGGNTSDFARFAWDLIAQVESSLTRQALALRIFGSLANDIQRGAPVAQTLSGLQFSWRQKEPLRLARWMAIGLLATPNQFITPGDAGTWAADRHRVLVARIRAGLLAGGIDPEFFSDL